MTPTRRFQCSSRSILVRASVITEHTWNTDQPPRFTPADRRRSSGRMGQTACKPGSVPLGRSRTRRSFLWTDPRGSVLATHPDRSGRRRPCPASPEATQDPPELQGSEGGRSLFGLAPGGACHAIRVAADPVRSYRTLSPFPPALKLRRAWPFVALAEKGVCFLWRFPWDRSRRVLPAALSPWSPDFPPSSAEASEGDRPAVWPRRKGRPSGLARQVREPPRHEGRQGPS